MPNVWPKMVWGRKGGGDVATPIKVAITPNSVGGATNCLIKDHATTPSPGKNKIRTNYGKRWSNKTCILYRKTIILRFKQHELAFKTQKDNFRQSKYRLYRIVIILYTFLSLNISKILKIYLCSLDFHILSLLISVLKHIYYYFNIYFILFYVIFII